MTYKTLKRDQRYVMRTSSGRQYVATLVSYHGAYNGRKSQYIVRSESGDVFVVHQISKFIREAE